LNIPENISNTLQQYFDKIFILSVPRFANRHKTVAEKLAGLQYDFFWGTDKLELDLKKAKQDGVYDEKKTKQLQRQGKPLNPGELACSLSHRMVYEEIVKHNWTKVLILEDDVVPLHDNLTVIINTLNELPADWELLYLGYLKNETITPALRRKQFFYKLLSALGLMKWSFIMVSNMLPRKYSTHLKKAGFHDCTHAYAVTLNGAKKLLDAQTPVVYRADDALSHTILQGKLKAFVTEPKFFDQEMFHNTAASSEIQ
jgi:glycosyl transferase, family 25